jgi:methanogenic corrinoid protein MtbC1
MIKQFILERYLNSLLSGDRQTSRAIIEEALQSGSPAHQVYMDIIWPIMVEVDNLYRDDRITAAQEAFASRINRSIVNQLQNKLPRRPGKNKRVVIVTACSEQAELGGQMTSDLFESDGWQTRFLGGAVNNEDILEFVHEYAPDVLILYGFNGKDAPAIRGLIDHIRRINAHPDMRIMLSGGVFSRAEGLWEEIGADLYAETAAEAIHFSQLNSDQLPTPVRTIKQRSRAPKLSEEPVELESAIR